MTIPIYILHLILIDFNTIFHLFSSYVYLEFKNWKNLIYYNSNR